MNKQIKRERGKRAYLQGINGEQIAAQYLKENGHHILDTNFKCRRGEIDIISQKEQLIIFHEVKTYHNTTLDPRFSISRSKAQALAHTIELYRLKKKLTHLPCQVDLLCVQGEVVTHHLENIDIQV